MLTAMVEAGGRLEEHDWQRQAGKLCRDRKQMVSLRNDLVKRGLIRCEIAVSEEGQALLNRHRK